MTALPSSGRLCGRRGRPSAAEAERLSDHILDTGWRMLLEGGFESFSFERLARAARTGKPTIYSRFGDKRGFLRSLLERRNLERTKKIRAMGRDLPFEQALCVQASHVLDMLFSDEGVLFERLVDWIDEEPGGDGPTARGAAYDNAIASIRAMLAEGVSHGEARFDDIEEAAVFWLEAMLGHARLAKSQGTPDHADNERWARIHTQRFLRAFAQA
ncbi:MAG: TetR/AcrR family transcriptional regulator [Sphingomonadales bacterium]|nr:TetR/AcrR family transcriptional regulator [Sphingomonadales bacterium]MDE2568509.1 TetR/AcrR family transcriptional regulator [Sphingomonadales bacterium]